MKKTVVNVDSEAFTMTFIQLNNMGRDLSFEQFTELVEVVTAGLPTGEDVWSWILSH